jgi:MFS family permease
MASTPDHEHGGSSWLSSWATPCAQARGQPLPPGPVPFLLAWAPAWRLIVAANVCLGVNQGLTSSMVVNMKIDLVGPRGRGLAMGLNEAAGYMPVGATALATGYLAAAYGLRPVPELLGVIYAVAGFALSAAVVRDTAGHVAAETAAHAARPDALTRSGAGTRRFWTVFKDASWQSRPLCGASQAGLANNLNDGLTWAVFPLIFASHGLGLAAIGLIKGLYPMLWGGGQLLTGRLADTIGRRPLIVTGMIVQAAAFPAALVLLGWPLAAGLVSAILLGTGTAMAQPALSAVVADHTHPSWRAQGLGVYRFWRDLGYAIGALIAGLMGQAFGLSAAVIAGGALTFASALLAARWITGSPPQHRTPRPAARTARAGGPHGDPDVAGAVPGYFRHAEPLVERSGPGVDGEHVQDEVLALPPGLLHQRADQAGADAAALMAGEDLDAGEVDLARPVFDVQHADICPAGGDDLPAVRVEPAGVEATLALLVPPPDRGDVAAHGGLVQAEAELAVGRGRRAQPDAGHAAAQGGGWPRCGWTLGAGASPVARTAGWVTCIG